MLGYYLKLACKSFARTPGLTALMLLAIALGIGVCVATLTVYHAMSGNPIWWKNDRLYAVTLDSWDPTRPADTAHPLLPPSQVTYKDATALFSSSLPERKVIMYALQLVINGGAAQTKPTQVTVRVTSSDFFAMFDVPFLYGGGWSAGADSAALPVIVLSKHQNDRLFGGVNSVGRTLRVNEREFRVAGVLDAWRPLPKFYDLNAGAFSDAEDAYIPFGWTTVLEQYPNAGNTSCWGSESINSFQGFLHSDCVWMQMWVELPGAASLARMRAFLDQYWAEQRRAGRFPRPRNNRLTNVGQWLADQEVVSNDNRILLGVAFAFLGVCLINTVGILLARFLNAAPITGVRRALGASRIAIFTQHLVEVGLLASTGALLGLALAALGLAGLRAVITLQRGRTGAEDPFGSFDVLGGYRALAHFDGASILWAIALAVLSTLAAGLYPAWRVGRLPPARYLKSQ
jgi:putative ABC transport system permease protein